MQTSVVRADKLKIWQFPELPKHRYCQEQHIWELRIAFPSVDGWSNQEFPSQKDQKSQNLVSHFGSAPSLRRTTGSSRFADFKLVPARAFVPWRWPKGTRLWGREWENVGIRSLCACLRGPAPKKRPMIFGWKIKSADFHLLSRGYQILFQNDFLLFLFCFKPKISTLEILSSDGSQNRDKINPFDKWLRIYYRNAK